MMEANNNPANKNENRLVFCSNPGTLQELACVVASASIWGHQMKKSSCWSMPLPLTCLFRDYSEIASLPSVLRQMIKECIPIVERSLIEWNNFHASRVFSHREDEDYFMVGFINFISWRADGTINFEETAKNLIQCYALSRMEKYRLACIYCFVDDVRKLWPVKTDADHSLIRYWNCRMSGEQLSIQVGAECSCVEASLLQDDYADTRSAFEYLWGFLTDEEQVQKVMRISNWTDGKWLLEYALIKLSESQLKRVLTLAAGDVFYELYLESEALIVPLWDHVKNMISPTDFHEIIIMFLALAPWKAPSLAYDIWIRAPDFLKNHVLAGNFENVLDNATKDSRLFIELLLTRDVETREIIWREKWKDIIVTISPSHLQQIMELCLASDDDVASFKRTHLCNYPLIEKCCKRMVFEGRFNELSEFFQFSSDDHEIIFNLKKNVLKSQYLLDAFIRVQRVKDMGSLITFLRDTFPDTNERNEFKRNLILSDESLAYFRLAMQNDRNLIVGIKMFVCKILSSDADLALAKSKFLMLSYEVLISGDFIIDLMSKTRNDFIKWCLDGDDEALNNFKRSLPVNEIFYTMFEKCALELKQSLDRNVAVAGEPVLVSSVDVDSIFSNLTWFLEWIFPTKKAVLDFKRDKLSSYFSIEQMRSIFEINDGPFIDKLLCWLLNNDRSRVEIFKISFCRVRFRKRKRRQIM